MENNWSPPSLKWTVSRISLNVTARWMRGSASLWSPCAQWHFSQVLWNVPVTPDLCPLGVLDTSWKKWERVGDGNEVSQTWGEEERRAEDDTVRPPWAAVHARESCAGHGRVPGITVLLAVSQNGGSWSPFSLAFSLFHLSPGAGERGF